MSALALRIMAIVCMVLDHVGYATGCRPLRLIGRLALPIFAFLIANGFRYTRSVPKYAARLALFALVSEVPFDLFFNKKITFVSMGGILPDFYLDNVFFTLLFGLCVVWLHEIYKTRVPRLAPIFSACTVLIFAYGAAFVSADYGVFGVLWVALFGIWNVEEKKNRLPLCIGAALLASWRLLCSTAFTKLGIAFSIPVLSAFIPLHATTFMDRIQVLSVLAIVPILLYNQKSGMPRSKPMRKVLQYAFYLIYPVHILILWLVF